jgi:hypothetical protein
MVKKRVMMTEMSVVGNKEDNGDSSKSNGDIDKGGRWALTLVKST